MRVIEGITGTAAGYVLAGTEAKERLGAVVTSIVWRPVLTLVSVRLVSAQ